MFYSEPNTNGRVRLIRDRHAATVLRHQSRHQLRRQQAETRNRYIGDSPVGTSCNHDVHYATHGGHASRGDTEPH